MQPPSFASAACLLFLFAVAGCDDDDDGSNGSPDISSSSSSGVSSSSGGADESGEDLNVDAKVRVANFFSRAAGQGTALDVRQRRGQSESDVVQNVAFEQVSPYFTPGKFGLSIYDHALPAATGHLSDVLTLDDFFAGERQLVLLFPFTKDDGTLGVAEQDLQESTTGNYPFVVVPGRAAVRVAPAPESSIEDRFKDPQIYYLRAKEGGCAVGDPPELIGGTVSVLFDLPPGETDLAFYGDSDCAGELVLPKQTVTLEAGSRTHVVIGGTTKSDLRAFVFPVPAP